MGSGKFELVELGNDGDVSSMTGLQIEQDAIANDVFRMLRTEDGAWDPCGDGRHGDNRLQHQEHQTETQAERHSGQPAKVATYRGWGKGQTFVS